MSTPILALGVLAVVVIALLIEAWLHPNQEEEDEE